MDFDVRALRGEDELARALQVFATAMVTFRPPPIDSHEALQEPGRTLGALVGPRIVGTATSFTSDLVVPAAPG